MKKIINFKFILVSTLTYIPFTMLWFFWHNNLFPDIYYASSTLISVNSKELQNIWAMNFANALLVYGFVFFYFRMVKDEIKLTKAVLWGIYYCLSAIGFYSFLNYGMLSNWRIEVLIYDLVFAVIGGICSGILVYYLYIKIIIKKHVTPTGL